MNAVEVRRDAGLNGPFCIGIACPDQSDVHAKFLEGAQVTQDVLDSPVGAHNLREPDQLERSMGQSIEAGLQAGVKGIVDGGNVKVWEPFQIGRSNQGACCGHPLDFTQVSLFEFGHSTLLSRPGGAFSRMMVFRIEQNRSPSHVGPLVEYGKGTWVVPQH